VKDYWPGEDDVMIEAPVDCMGFTRITTDPSQMGGHLPIPVATAVELVGWLPSGLPGLSSTAA